MTRQSLSPRSSLRKSIRDISRSRGHRNNNLWQDYSVKTDRDWVFPSDRQFIHWLYYLEGNPDVVTFDLAPGVVISSDDKEQRGTELDAIAIFRDGHKEWHEVKAGNELLESDSSQFTAQRKAASEENATYLIFNDRQLIPVAISAMRWLKALSFAKEIRDEAHTDCRIAVVQYAMHSQAGSIGSLLNAVGNHDESVVLGVLVRLAVEGVVALRLDEMSFGYRTRWFYGS